MQRQMQRKKKRGQIFYIDTTHEEREQYRQNLWGQRNMETK